MSSASSLPKGYQPRLNTREIETAIKALRISSSTIWPDAMMQECAQHGITLL